jgi:hypothetical protein
MKHTNTFSDKSQSLLMSQETVYLTYNLIRPLTVCNVVTFCPHTALTDWFLQPKRSVFAVRYGLDL